MKVYDEKIFNYYKRASIGTIETNGVKYEPLSKDIDFFDNSTPAYKKGTKPNG